MVDGGMDGALMLYTMICHNTLNEMNAFQESNEHYHATTLYRRKSNLHR